MKNFENIATGLTIASVILMVCFLLCFLCFRIEEVGLRGDEQGRLHIRESVVGSRAVEPCKGHGCRCGPVRSVEGRGSPFGASSSHDSSNAQAVLSSLSSLEGGSFVDVRESKSGMSSSSLSDRDLQRFEFGGTSGVGGLRPKHWMSSPSSTSDEASEYPSDESGCVLAS